MSAASANGNGAVPSSSSAPQGAAAPAPDAAVAGPAGMPHIPEHVQQALSGLNKQRLQGMVQRMQQLKAAGETEQSSQELANLVNILRYFQQVQLMKQQQQQQQQLQQQAQQSASQANAQQAASSSSSQPAASTSQAATPAAAAASTPAAPAPEAASTPAAAANGDHSSANGANGVVASASGPASQAASAAAPSPAANGTPTTNAPSAFTPEQLAALKTQIIAFKLISRNMPLPPHLQAALLNPDAAIDEIRGGLPDLQSLGEAGAVAEAGVAAHQAAELVSTAKEEAAKAAMVKRPATPKDDTSSAVYPYNALRQPFTYLSKPATGPEDSAATKQQRLLVPSLLPAGLDPQLLIAERDRLIAARVQQRIRELESLPSTISQWPTLRGADAAEMKREQDGRNEGEDLWESSTFEADNAKIKALIELKSLKLLEKQKALRHSLVRGFSAASTLALDRTAFRKFKKQTLRDARLTETLERKQRADRERRTRQKHTDYLNTIVAHGRELQAAHRNAQSNAQRIGKSVLRLHAETEKEEAKRLERIAKERLNALRADDEEAYLKLVDTAKDTRITHLIRQTDAYLGSLADAVQAQQNDDVHADAIAAERAGIAPPTAEELAAQTANQQVGVAVDETMFGARREDDPVEKGKVDYYSVAHRITEHITEQPTILVGGKLKHYQIKGLQWMVSLYNNRLNGILADEMGLGKTIQTISLITFLIEHKRQPGPYLVIVPLSTLTNWINEFEKWAPSVNTLVFKGPPLARKHLSNRIRAGNFQVLLTTYEYIIKEKGLLGKIRWTHMIIDEGHRMKNTQSKLTITLMQSYVSRYRLLLTGTPLQNNLPELWALLNFVLPKIFNSVKSFDEWFNTPFANTGTSGDGAMQLNEEEALLIIKRLHKVLRPFLLRRLKKDVESELPDKVEKVIKCKMSSLQRKLYQQMKNHKMLLAGDEAGPGQKQKQQGIKGLQNAIMQLRKICNHPYVFEQVEVAINPMKQNGPDLYRVCGKFELLDRLLPKLKATGHRVLIFFQMTAIMDIMEDFLRYRNHKYLRLDGSTKPDDRSLQLKEFNAPNSDIFCFILSTRAGGLGLNLQTADTVIIYDSDWNPHQDLQAQDRAHRIGQKMEVRILRLVTEKSVEEAILETANRKLQIDGKVIQAGKFDNSSGNEEREDLLRAMLEADQDEEEEEEGELGDDELNQILARGENEVGKFEEMDKQREKDYAEEWRARGHKGKIPERLIQESELPSIYQQDFDAVALDAPVEEEPLVRKRNVVRYDDGLTEEQFLRALEDDDVDMAEIVEQKRERADKRKAKLLAASREDSQTATPEPSTSKKKGKKLLGDTPDASPGPSGSAARKRKRAAGPTDTPTPDRDESPARGGAKSGAAAGGKRQKTADDAQRDRLKDALLRCYRALENAHDDDGRQRCALFVDIPKKQDYPDYHVIIQQPIAMRQVKRRIDNRTYRQAYKCRDDIHLMVKNAKTYNQEGSWVWNDAVALLEAFEAAYDLNVRGTDLPGIEEGQEDAPPAAEEPDDAPSSARPRIKLSVKRGRVAPDDE